MTGSEEEEDMSPRCPALPRFGRDDEEEEADVPLWRTATSRSCSLAGGEWDIVICRTATLHDPAAIRSSRMVAGMAAEAAPRCWYTLLSRRHRGAISFLQLDYRLAARRRNLEHKNKPTRLILKSLKSIRVRQSCVLYKSWKNLQ